MKSLKFSCRVALSVVLLSIIFTVIFTVLCKIVVQQNTIVLAEETATYYDGDGTASNPYSIGTAEQLKILSQHLSLSDSQTIRISKEKKVTVAELRNSHFKLTKDIYLNSSDFTTKYNSSLELIEIQLYNQTAFMNKNGNLYTDDSLTVLSSLPINTFTPICGGANFTFDGDGHTVYGLVVNAIASNNAMFNNNGGTVKNITLRQSIVLGGDNTAGLVANNSGEILNAFVECIVIGGNNIGGIAGENSGRISNSASIGDIVGVNNVGGITGTSEGLIKNCFSAGSVYGQKYVGGIIGKSTDPTMFNCFYEINKAVTASGNIQTAVGTSSGTPKNEKIDIDNITSLAFDTKNTYYTYKNSTFTQVIEYADKPLAKVLNGYCEIHNSVNSDKYKTWLTKDYYAHFVEEPSQESESEITLNQSCSENPPIKIFTVNSKPTDLIYMPRVGYSFEGYFTKENIQVCEKDGIVKTSIPDITDATGIWLAGDIELFAKWSVNTYVVNYTGLEDCIPTSIQPETAYYNKAFNVNKTSIYKKGYEFKGWEYIVAGKTSITNNEISSNDICLLEETETKTLTLTAVFVKEKFAVSFSKGDNLADAYITNDKSALDGDRNGESYEYLSTMYLIIQLKPNTDQYSYTPPVGFIPLSERRYYLMFAVDTTINFGEVDAVEKLQSYTTSAFAGENVEAIEFLIDGETYFNSATAPYGTVVRMIIKVKPSTPSYMYSVETKINLIRQQDNLYIYDYTISAFSNFGTFNAIQEERKYTVTFNKGEHISDLYITDNSLQHYPSGKSFNYNKKFKLVIVLAENTPKYSYSIQGYTFDKENGYYFKDFIINDDLDLGKISAMQRINTVTLTFTCNDKYGYFEGETTITVEYGQSFVVPTLIPNANYRFAGWNKIIPQTATISESFYAIIVQKPSVEFDTQPQKREYDKTSKPYIVNNANADYIGTEYFYDDKWQQSAPIAVGIYTVRFTRAESDEFHSLNYTLEGGYEIAKRPITINCIVKDKVYDKSLFAEIESFEVNNIINGDDIHIFLEGKFPTANIGIHDIYLGYRVLGESAGNYTVSQINKATAEILPAILTINANDAYTVLGQEEELTYTVAGLFQGDVLSGELSREEGNIAGFYNITRGTLQADNYIIVFNPATYTINAPSIEIKDKDMGISLVIDTEEGFSPNINVELAEVLTDNELFASLPAKDIVYAFDLCNTQNIDLAKDLFIKVKYSSKANINKITVINLDGTDAVKDFYLEDGYLVIQTSALGSYVILEEKDYSHIFIPIICVFLGLTIIASMVVLIMFTKPKKTNLSYGKD